VLKRTTADRALVELGIWLLNQARNYQSSERETMKQEERRQSTNFTVSNSLLHPAARIGSPGFKPTARTATMMSSGPITTRSGTSRNSSFEGGPKVRTPMARMSFRDFKVLNDEIDDLSI
jgi:hypothetical protein